jgi:hypothetical protein|tara:strand:+ start:569 stop:1447 length:879 start_codon:yes stop_codon:yes gene_type:complete
MNDTVLAAEAKPNKKVAFVSRPYSRDDKIKKDEEELKQMLEEQKAETETPPAEPEEKEPETAEERTFKKRYGDLRRHVQEKEKQFQGEIDSLKQQLSAATKKEMKLPKSDADLDAWIKEYPDVAGIVETIAIKKAKEQSKALEEKMKAIDDMQLSAQKEKAEAELMQLHPDFSTIRDSDEFHEWAEKQPQWVQNALYENDNDAMSASRAIDLYKADKGILGDNKKTTKTSKGAAEAVATKARQVPQTNEASSYIKESDVQKMSAKEYEKKSDEIMEAIRSGKFIYDISGSAR